MISFSNSHLIGIKEIDDQHKKLFEIVNDIYMDIVEHNSTDIDRYFVDLVAYSAYHSRTENKYLLELSNSDTIDLVNSHIKEHTIFSDFLISQIEKYSMNRKTVTTTILVDMAIFLNKWMSNHVLKHDKKIFDLLLNKDK